MKAQDFKNWKRALLALLLSVGLTSLNKAEANPFPGVSFQVFYDELAPYGDWVQDQNLGYIWLPFAEQGFHPYGSNGHWAMTSYGNTWVSYYDWGWAPFHYGRWYFDNYYQSWAWVPDYDWGPAWVNWRTGGGYYGWAPLAPGFSLNVGYLPSSYFVFIPRNRIYHHYAHRYYAPYRNRVRIYNQTTIINNTVIYNDNRYVAGPNRREIERVTNRSVPVYQVQGSDRAGRAAVSRNSISLYRPELENSRSRNAEARPTRVLNANEARSSRSQATDRSVSNSSRSANSSVGNLDTPTNRSDRGTVRSNSPAQESRSFESRPFEDGRSRVLTPTRESQARPQVAPSGSRNPNPANVRTTPEVHRSEQTRTQYSQPDMRSSQMPQTQSSRPEARPSQTPRSQAPQPSVRTAPQQQRSPEVRPSSRTAPANSNVATPSSNQKSGASRVSTAPSIRSSTNPTSRSSSSRTIKPGGN